MAIYSISFLPGKCHGQRSLVGYSPWGCRRVGHNLSTEQHYSLGPFTFCKWQYSPYILRLSSIPLREGNGNPLQYSCLANLMDGRAWQAAVHGVARSRTRLNVFTFTFHFHPLEKEMTTHSSVLSWRIPGMGEPGGLLSQGSHRVEHD